MDKLIEQAAKDSKTLAEALGKSGMIVAQTRLGYIRDKGYIDRYHGPDDITRKNGKLAE